MSNKQMNYTFFCKFEMLRRKVNVGTTYSNQLIILGHKGGHRQSTVWETHPASPRSPLVAEKLAWCAAPWDQIASRRAIYPPRNSTNSSVRSSMKILFRYQWKSFSAALKIAPTVG